MQQLTIGNIINIGISIYQLNLKHYLRLALIAHLWLLIPVYGWGRYLAIAGLISRLTWQQLADDTNELPESQLFSIRIIIHFLITGTFVVCLSSLFAFIFLFLLFFSIILLGVLLFSLLDFQTNFAPANSTPILILIGASVYLTLFVLSTWFYSRLFITDLVLSIESSHQLLTPITRSYQLTQKMQLKINRIIWLSFAITLSGMILSYILLAICVSILETIRNLYFPSLFSYNLILNIYILFWLVLGNITTMPFWQSIKAIVYYQTRCDREGFDFNASNFNL